MTKLSTLKIRRFKQVQDATVSLRDVTLLIGANNSGKSTVLQALHFAVSVAQTAKLVGEGLSWRNDKFELSFNPTQLIYSPVADVMSLATGGQLQEATGARIEIELTSQAAETCTVGVRRGRNRNIQIVVEGRALGEKLMDIEHPFTVFAPGLAGIPKEERYLSPGVVRRIVARGDANLVLRNIFRMLHRDQAKWTAFLEDMREIFPGIDISLEFNENTDEHIGAYVQLGSAPRLPLDAAGTSVLQASQILGYVSVFGPKVLILDEPDSHLHPNNQRALCALVSKLSTSRGFQVLVSTHSRHVMDAMSRSGPVVWMSKGQIRTEEDQTATQELLDLGALDSVDYFANGALKCVVATEDADQSRLKPLLLASGFVEDDLEIASYAGCSKADAAVVLGKFLKDKTQHLSLVVHRDSDYLAADAATKFTDKLTAAGLHPFLTELNDVECYFINAAHLHSANPSIDEARVQTLVDEATSECRDESIKAIVNLRTAAEFQKLRGTGKTPDHGQIALDAARDYDANPAQLRRGDIVIGRLTAKLQAEMKSNPRVFVVSPHLNCPPLKEIAS